MSNQLETGKLIVFEGPDGVGKSTLARCLVGRLKEWRIRSEYATFPGKRPGTIGQVIYEIHHDPGRFGIEQLSRTSLQALHIAAHLDAIEQFILPALGEGTSVILDRFWWSTWVYGRVSGVESSVLDAMIEVERMHWGGTQPDVLFLVDRSDAPTDHEGEVLRRAYRTLYDSEQSKYAIRMVHNDAPVAAVVNDMLSVLDDLLGGIARNTVLGE